MKTSFKRKRIIPIVMAISLASCAYQGDTFNNDVKINIIRNYEVFVMSSVGIVFEISSNYDTENTKYHLSWDMGYVNGKKFEENNPLILNPNETIYRSRYSSSSNDKNNKYGFFSCMIKETSKDIGYVLIGVGDSTNANTNQEYKYTITPLLKIYDSSLNLNELNSIINSAKKEYISSLI